MEQLSQRRETYGKVFVEKTGMERLSQRRETWKGFHREDMYGNVVIKT